MNMCFHLMPELFPITKTIDLWTHNMTTCRHGVQSGQLWNGMLLYSFSTVGLKQPEFPTSERDFHHEAKTWKDMDLGSSHGVHRFWEKPALYSMIVWSFHPSWFHVHMISHGWKWRHSEGLRMFDRHWHRDIATICGSFAAPCLIYRIPTCAHMWAHRQLDAGDTRLPLPCLCWSFRCYTCWPWLSFAAWHCLAELSLSI